jgi:phasin
MTADPTPQFEIPNEIRAVAERSVDQAKSAFTGYMRAAEEAVSTLEHRVQASQVGAQDIGNKAMHFAERNVVSAFELAEKLLKAKDIQELVRIQTEFVQSQMKVLAEQVKDFGETVSKAAIDSMKATKKVGLSS